MERARKMTGKKRISLFLRIAMSLSMLLCCFNVSIHAETVDPEQTGSITLSMQDGNTALNTGSLECIQVGRVEINEEGNPEYVYTDAFAGEKMPLKNIHLPSVGKELDAYATNNKITGKTGLIRSGSCRFSSLKPGVYLIRQKTKTTGYEEITPFLMTMPEYDEKTETYLYDVAAAPKTAITPIDREEPRKPGTEGPEPYKPTTNITTTIKTNRTTAQKPNTGEATHYQPR